MELFKRLEQEWAVVSGAPFTVAAVLLLASLLAWWFCRTLYAARIAALEERIQLRDDKIKALQDRLEQGPPSAEVEEILEEIRDIAIMGATNPL